MHLTIDQGDITSTTFHQTITNSLSSDCKSLICLSAQHRTKLYTNTNINLNVIIIINLLHFNLLIFLIKNNESSQWWLSGSKWDSKHSSVVYQWASWDMMFQLPACENYRQSNCEWTGWTGYKTHPQSKQHSMTNYDKSVKNWSLMC